MTKQEKLNSQIDTVSDILNICDEVKFARRSTSEDEQKSALVSANEFVRYEVLPDKLPEKEVKDE